MIVKMIAHTALDESALSEFGWQEHSYAGKSWDEIYEDADLLAEFAGRNCYQSWERPNPKTATNEGYLDHILEVNHASVLEHASATFMVTEVSRSFLIELERHRHLSFSVLSQRYVDHSDAAFVPNARVRRAAAQAGIPLGELATSIKLAYTAIYDQLRADGLAVKQAREAARWVLPNATETKIVVTGNMRTWRYVIAARDIDGADVEIREFAVAVLDELKLIAPHTFQDM